MRKFITQLLIVSILATSSFVVLPKTTIASLTDSLEVHWAFDERTGTSVTDSSGNGNTGTLVSDPKWLGGQIGGGAVRLNGSTQYVSTADSLGGLTDFGVSFWMNTNTRLTSGVSYLVSQYDITGDQRSWAIVMDWPASEVQINLSTNGTSFTGVIPFNDAGVVGNGWSHVVFTRSGSTVKGYVNGVEMASGTFSGTLFNSSSNITVGANGAGGSLFPGDIDDVRIYSRALTTTDIDELYDLANISYDDGFGYCRELTMTAGGSSGVATTTTRGFPLVATTTLSDFRSTANGGNIQTVTNDIPLDFVFAGGDDCSVGGKKLDFYVEDYASTTGEIVSWFQPLDISSTTAKSVLIYYGKASAEDLQNRAGVFDSQGEFAVYDMNQDPSGASYPQVIDNTINGLHGTSTGSMTSGDLVTGYLGGALDFDNSNDAIELYNGDNTEMFAPLPITFSVWVNQVSDSFHTIVSTAFWADGTDNFGAQLLTESDGRLNARYFDGGTKSSQRGKTTDATATTIVPDSKWTHIAGVIRGATDMDLYINGVNAGGTYNGSGGSIAYTIGGNTSPYGTLGKYDFTGAAGGFAYFNGIMDDARFAKNSAHAMDILTMYNNTKSSGEFFTFGAMESDGGDVVAEVFSKPSLVVLGNLIINSTRKSVVLGNSNSHSHDLESGSSQYLSITDGTQTGLDLTGDFTMEAYINLESSGNNQDVLSKWNASDGHRSYIWRLNPTAGTVELLLSDDGVFLTTDTVSVTLPTSTWIHLAITYDASAGTAEVFKDGVSQGTMTGLDTSIRNGGAPFVIGAQETSTSAGSFFDGLIDEMRIWNVVRASSEIADNDDEELTGSESGLVAYWKFNNNRTDTTSNNNDLSAVNTPIFSTTVPFANYQGSETEYGGGIFNIY